MIMSENELYVDMDVEVNKYEMQFHDFPHTVIRIISNFAIEKKRFN